MLPQSRFRQLRSTPHSPRPRPPANRQMQCTGLPHVACAHHYIDSGSLPLVSRYKRPAAFDRNADTAEGQRAKRGPRDRLSAPHQTACGCWRPSSLDCVHTPAMKCNRGDGLESRPSIRIAAWDDRRSSVHVRSRCEFVFLSCRRHKHRHRWDWLGSHECSNRPAASKSSSAPQDHEETPVNRLSLRQTTTELCEHSPGRLSWPPARLQSPRASCRRVPGTLTPYVKLCCGHL